MQLSLVITNIFNMLVEVTAIIKFRVTFRFDPNKEDFVTFRFDPNKEDSERQNTALPHTTLTTKITHILSLCQLHK